MGGARRTPGGRVAHLAWRQAAGDDGSWPKRQ